MKYYKDVNYYNFRDKSKSLNYHIKYFLNRLESMFKWTGLPDTIPQRMLELQLLTTGYTSVMNVNGELYALYGGLGGEPDAYMRPTIYTVSNPALKYSANLEIGKDCVLIPNDSLLVGCLPLLRRYCTLLTENELSMLVAQINTRIISLISAPDDRTRASAEQYLNNIENGKTGVIAENAFLDGVRSQPYGNANTNALTQLIELEQYTKASLFNELGLNSNYNMKRESLNSNESQLNDDMLTPLIDDMLNCRRLACEEINALFGTSISVDFAGAWKENEIETENALDSERSESGAETYEEESGENDNDEET